MRKLVRTLEAALLAILFGSCSDTPKGVISSDDMASLLADIYTGESVIELNRTQFSNDSMRKSLRQSIYMAHGVTASEVDTSFMWYGAHLDKYIEVHDKVIELLEKRIDGTTGTTLPGMSESGDSVDAWTDSKHYLISRKSPTRVITFELKPDQNWQRGDYYQWALKTLNSRQPATWMMAAEYRDGSVEYHQGQLQGEGWSRIQLLTDSTQTPRRIYGYLVTSPVEGEDIYIDSVELIRKRVNQFIYKQRARQRTIGGVDKSAASPAQSPSSKAEDTIVSPPPHALAKP